MENVTLMDTTDTYFYEDYVHNFSLYDDDLYSNVLVDRHIDTHIAALIIIVIIVIILSLIGNILVVVISVFCVRLQSLTTIFILNLALSDLLFTVGMSFWVYGFIWDLPFSDAACRVYSFAFSAGHYSSIVFLVLMSVQCYMAIVHPLSSWRKKCHVIFILIGGWMVSILAALPATVLKVVISFYGSCVFSTISAVVAIMHEHNSIFLCAFLFMGFCYIRILQTIFKSPRNQRNRTTGLSFLLVATFFIFWAPYNILIFLLTLSYYQIEISFQVLHHLIYASYVCQLLAFARCCLNPVIYGLLGLIFRKEAQRIFQRRATVDSEQMGRWVSLNNE